MQPVTTHYNFLGQSGSASLGQGPCLFLLSMTVSLARQPFCAAAAV